MKNGILAGLTGMAIGCCGGIFFDRAHNGELVEHWRAIKPGTQIAELTSGLDDALYRFEPGESWPHWAEAATGEGHSDDSGLHVFYVEDRGPNLLLVVFDEQGAVKFVVSANT